MHDVNEKHTHWITYSYEIFQDNFYHGNKLGSPDNPIDFLIIGSGYGGSIAAAEITQYLQTIQSTESGSKSVVVLERGDEFIPGKFPTTLSEVVRHVRVSSASNGTTIGNKDGLFDVRVNDSVNCLLANGLGGGSLINAGVMRRPMAHVFDDRWPSAISLETLTPYLNEAEVRLGSHIQSDSGNAANTIERQSQAASSKPSHSKTHFLQQHSIKADKNPSDTHQFSFEFAATTVAYETGVNQSNVTMNACINCGDCATGCNHNAKNSLDANLLYEAYQRGAEIVTGVTVLSFERDASDSHWCVHTRYTNDKLFERDPGSHDTPGVHTLCANHVLLCAGSLGSTEILMNAAALGTSVSEAIGSQFSSNGDMIAFYPTDHLTPNDVRPKSSGEGSQKPDARGIGPTIGGVINAVTKKGVGEEGYESILIEEMAIPATIREVFEQPTSAVMQLQRAFREFSSVRSLFSGQRPEKTDPDVISHTGIYAAIGDDLSAGRLAIPVEERQRQ